MEGVFNKFSIYDFFNLVFGGGIFLAGLQMIGFRAINYFENTFGNIENEIFAIALSVLICYLVGFGLQEIALFIDQRMIKMQQSMTSTFLIDNNRVVKNAERVKVYQEKAKQLFKVKKISVINNEFSKDQCEYFFAYCSRFVQVCGKNEKAEKLRNLKSLSNLFMICFGLLFLAGSIRSIICWINGNVFTEFGLTIFCSVFFLFFSVISYYRTKVNIRSWILLLLGTYEVCSDMYTQQ